MVAAEDAYGNVVTSFKGPVTLTVASNPGHGTLGGKLKMIAANGVASFSGLKIDRAGSGYLLKAGGGSLAAATSSPVKVTD